MNGNTVVWIVRFGNYWPAEVDSIWGSECDAIERADELGGMWDAERVLLQHLLDGDYDWQE